VAAEPKGKAAATIGQLLDEMATRHPEIATYLRTMAGRAQDFTSLTP
jgi:hypothetical protein